MASISPNSSKLFETPEVEAHFAYHTQKLGLDAENTKYEGYQIHFTKSQKAIADVVKKVAGGTAIIFGPGPSNDLPLRTLAERFERITFVDATLGPTIKAVETLPQNLRNKFVFESGDLTGVFDEFGKRVLGLDKNLSYDEFISQVVKILPTLQRKKYPYQQSKASFVCSSLVCSQLGGQMEEFLEKLCEERYKKKFITPKEFHNYTTEIQLNHIREARDLTEENGTTYFADHFSAAEIRCLRSQIETTEAPQQEMDFPGVTKIQETLGKYFSTLAKLNWTWRLPIKKFVGDGKVIHDD